MALQRAAIDISHLSCRNSLVLLGMANEEALQHTVPYFLESLSRVAVTAGKDAGHSLVGRVVLVAWSQDAMKACQALQATYNHQCVRDAQHTAATGSFVFHDTGFNSLGFAKVKYILNGLSLGHDVVFLDTDIVVMRDPLPYLLVHDADLFGSMEKCMVYNDSLSFNSPEFKSLRKRPPAINIGMLYFKASASVTRCVYNWAWEMRSEVQTRPRLWDQDIFGKVMVKCTAVHGLRFQVLDPRLFQSGCFPGCGCKFFNNEIRPDRIGRFSGGFRKLPAVPERPGVGSGLINLVANHTPPPFDPEPNPGHQSRFILLVQGKCEIPLSPSPMLNAPRND
ncbi:hypothetical protein VOLCADRAFT_117113 [Volvox carteri f. nagariensis]|uniref:Glycosyltransferase n=1 Tax=Volvox carteri f. nagariensis TaxID=3068 RepID=D8TSA7_VOLCA|nr:uncharacterized protein VOLCADRAFT_117113 [Volvox carteri f. nagariensis]EFJ49793.1 hypothetical protein VOLCADRAFT_117113 [Volvox carteri f. nagariensis]|eukprot:XP_002949300.1 hypothetical protein VOLCADRAFT_117113 [Volvox carteri f. nagariensis]